MADCADSVAGFAGTAAAADAPADSAVANAAAAPFAASARAVTVPVAVVLQRAVARTSKWGAPQWRVVAVVAGENLPNHDQAVVIHQDADCRRTLHSGLKLHLHTDGGEGYWVNLQSDAPYLFVVCEEVDGDGDELRPAFITANRDEANGYLEAERVVLPAPMPAAVCDLVERYVLSHYRPATKKKRARREWAAESEYANRPV